MCANCTRFGDVDQLHICAVCFDRSEHVLSQAYLDALAAVQAKRAQGEASHD